jgi:hypothetical protein
MNKLFAIEGVNSMLKSTTAAIAGLSLLMITAPSTFGASLPLLSGSYIYTGGRFCQMTIIAGYVSGKTATGSGTPLVAQINTGTDSSSQKLSGGILTFVQSGTGSGSASINGFDIGGTTILLQNTGSAIGGGGTQGSPLASNASSGNATFKQTATAATLVTPDGTDTFHAYYGKVVSGIVQSVSLIGVDHKGCAEQFMLTHR